MIDKDWFDFHKKKYCEKCIHYIHETSYDRDLSVLSNEYTCPILDFFYARYYKIEESGGLKSMEKFWDRHFVNTFLFEDNTCKLFIDIGE